MEGCQSPDSTFPRYPLLSQSDSSWLRQSPLPYKNSITSTHLHPTFKTNFAIHFMERSIWTVCRASRVMTPHGLSTIWTRCVSESPLLTQYSSQRRFSTFSNLPRSPPGGACANSRVFVARCGSFQHPTRSHLTSWSFIPSRLRLEVLAMYITGPSMV